MLLAAGSPLEWSVSDGYKMEQRGSAFVLLPPEHAGTEGSLTRRIAATPWRGKTFRATAALHTGGKNAKATARLWMRPVRSKQSAGSLLDYVSGDPVRAAEWSPSEVSGPIPNDAEAIEFGVASNGYDEVWIADVLPGGPRNLDFSRGPAEWKLSGEISTDDCMEAPRCAVLSKPGSIEQSFSAEGWHGFPIQVKAWVEFEPDRPTDTAEIFLRSEAPSGENTVWYRTIHATEWIEAEITHAIKDDTNSIGIGFSMTGGHLSIEQISLQPAPAAADNIPDGPSPAEQQKIIDQASRRAAAYISGLPDFMCTQKVSRWQKRGDGLFVKTDLLSVQLGYSDGAEHYKLTAIDDRPTTVSYKSMGGAVSQGEFGSMMREIFAPTTAKFRWTRFNTLRGRPVYVFSFTVAKEKSKYEVRYGSTHANESAAVVPYHGIVFIDRESGDILRLIQIADMPAGFAVRSASTVLDYDFAEVGGCRYLLPLSSESTMGTDSIQTRNETEYRDYRKFDAAVTITFDTPQ